MNAASVATPPGCWCRFRSGESDDIRRLEKIAAETAERKKEEEEEPAPAGSMFRTGLLQRAFLRLMPRERLLLAESLELSTRAPGARNAQNTQDRAWARDPPPGLAPQCAR